MPRSLLIGADGAVGHAGVYYARPFGCGFAALCLCGAQYLGNKFPRAGVTFSHSSGSITPMKSAATAVIFCLLLPFAIHAQEHREFHVARAAQPPKIDGDLNDDVWDDDP